MHEFDVINNADSCLIPEETTAESQLHQKTPNQQKQEKSTQTKSKTNKQNNPKNPPHPKIK